MYFEHVVSPSKQKYHTLHQPFGQLLFINILMHYFVTVKINYIHNTYILYIYTEESMLNVKLKIIIFNVSIFQ